MGVADGMSRRGNKSDYYVTPFPITRGLLANIGNLSGKTILDPCSGSGAIGKVLREYGYKYRHVDITTGNDFLEEKNHYDIIIANPPYSIKYKFIDHALKIADMVYMIFPLGVSSYNIVFKEYLNVPNFLGKYLTSPKFFMTQNECENPIRGGCNAYAWYVWSGVNSNVKRKNNQSFEKYYNWTDYVKIN